MRLNTLIRRVERLQGELLPAVKEACVKEEKAILDYQQLQLYRGMNAEGGIMGINYSLKHKNARLALGLPVDHVYLDFEGGLHEGMKVEYSNTGFSIVTDDWKMKLVEISLKTGYWVASNGTHLEYGPVFGLDDVSKNMLVWKIKPRVSANIRKRLLRKR